jgi:glycosyltransferase involved in cell wall biosynthesis
MPRITVILPTYNRARLLRDALTGLRLQTLNRIQWRVVVLDNASTDQTGDVVREFSDLPLIYDRNRQTCTPEANMMRGFSNYMDTEFIAMLCDDDLYAPHFLQSALQGADFHRDGALFSCGTIYGGNLRDNHRGLCDMLGGAASDLSPTTHTVRWSKDEWLLLHSVCSPVVITGCLFRSDALHAISPVFTPGVFMGDRWMLARLGSQSTCYSSPWPGTFLRLHEHNGYMNAVGETKRQAHRQCGDLVLSLCARDGIDVPGFWRAYTKNSPYGLPAAIQQGIYDCYPEGLRHEILGRRRPPIQGRLDLLPLPTWSKQILRKARHWAAHR